MNGSSEFLNGVYSHLMGCRNFLIPKYDTLGNLLWARNAGGINDDAASNISNDTLGNTYVAGTYAADITFGTFTLSSSGHYDVFLAKYDSSGNLLWVKSCSGNGFDTITGLSTDTAGNYYII